MLQNYFLVQFFKSLKNYFTSFPCIFGRKYLPFLFIFFGFFSAFGQTTDFFTAEGAATWTAPAGVTSITVQAWGAGGSGGGTATNFGSNSGGGGGAAGTYVTSPLTVVPGTTYNLYVARTTVGAIAAGAKGQGSWFNTSSILFAEGGNGGAAPNGALSAGGLGSITSSIGTTRTAGGNGGNGTAGSFSGAGGNATNGGGTGGASRTAIGDGLPGNAIGGGGGGAVVQNTDRPGGSGARGEVRITYTSASTYCRPTTDVPGNSYINNVRFLGTLNDVSNNNNNYSNGYQDFTGLTNKTSQVDGEGINIYVESNGVDTVFKAWVDWNRDNLFDNSGTAPTATSEWVYGSGSTRAFSTTFGIVIPPGTPPGDYRLRIRNYRAVDTGQASGFGGTDAYTSCQNFTGTQNITGTQVGEAEDYIIKVLSNCAANIVSVTDAVNCGPGALILSATANTGTTRLRWYDAETGGNLLATTNVNGVFTASFSTPSINATTIYYVTAFNGTCESIYRTPVVARISPIPVITFDLPQASANFCGDNNTLRLTSTGSNESVELFNEKFDSGLGIFTSTTGTNADFTATTNTSGTFPNSGVNTSVAANTGWQNKTSTYKPVGSIWRPAISSGFGVNKFAYATSDYANTTTHTILTTTSSYNTTNFLNLSLSFSAYYSYYGDTSAAAGGTVEGLFVEVFADGGAWTTVQAYKSSLGFGTKFNTYTIPLNLYIGIANLKIRFRHLAYWGDGLAIDNVRLTGDRPLTASFVWTAPNIGIYNADCTTPYVNGTTTDNVCIKPTATQLQTIPSWNISASVTISNGCVVPNSITVQNNNKYWDKNTTDWNSSLWLPVNSVPDITKCVFIKQPVILQSGADGAAKNISIEPGGSLRIKSPRSLTIDDYLRNNSTVDKFILESDANLLQNNATAVNVGSITAERSVSGLRNTVGTAVDYIYWGAPVTGQQTKGSGGFSPGTPNGSFFAYRESNDRFYETADLTFTPGRGYAVQAEAGVPAKIYSFKGNPNNGDVNFSITKSADNPVGTVHGYNLVSNPYPSNIAFSELYFGNSGLIYNTAWFWTNFIYERYQQGSTYNGNNYSVINGTGGVAATFSTYTGGVSSNGIIKVGQAFIIQAKGSGSLAFKNTFGAGHVLRTRSTGTGFFQKNNQNINRFWLNLVNPGNISNQQLIGYIDGASDSFEQDFDNEAFDNYSDLFYSVLDDKKLVIQGKANNFITEDKIKLGANFYETGTYTIALEKAEGLFANGQKIYLKDNLLGITFDLTAQNYTFSTVAGQSEGRFEIVYKPESFLGLNNQTKSELILYRDGNQFVLKSQKEIIKIEIYDGSGRLISVKNLQNKNTAVSAENWSQGVYIIKIIFKNGSVQTKKVSK
ncbi:Ig-like domain-containing protein [Halpernia frigidisoli]|uniref:Por secretion system C-terminal sorting domain-containing protein n=1 Tax=Halpernia frigidisoli TaxID=1125876 RepID=A0A1I3FDV3_9FLAO|nr:GEVED domain-containing protein [Halpernia frigidisoli]SFI09423.1 Por secretion system C-terminal sorting domain-containing protein [Halpernia frigidisoli]